MPWIDVDEPYAKTPRLPDISPRQMSNLTQGDGWTGLDRGWGELVDVQITADTMLDLSGCLELSIDGCRLSGVAIGGGEELELTLARSALDGCDLSQVRIDRVANSRITRCKLAGTDLSACALTDVVFEQCTLSMTNLRMAKLKRVQFVDCTLEEVDAYRLKATDVAVPGSSLTGFNLDGLTAERFDLRHASQISLAVANTLAGCLVAEHQLAGLAHALAFAAGVGVERTLGDD